VTDNGQVDEKLVQASISEAFFCRPVLRFAVNLLTRPVHTRFIMCCTAVGY